jgi:hypothetical protein
VNMHCEIWITKSHKNHASSPRLRIRRIEEQTLSNWECSGEYRQHDRCISAENLRPSRGGPEFGNPELSKNTQEQAVMFEALRVHNSKLTDWSSAWNAPDDAANIQSLRQAHEYAWNNAVPGAYSRIHWFPARLIDQPKHMGIVWDELETACKRRSEESSERENKISLWYPLSCPAKARKHQY